MRASLMYPETTPHPWANCPGLPTLWRWDLGGPSSDLWLRKILLSFLRLCAIHLYNHST